MADEQTELRAAALKEAFGDHADAFDKLLAGQEKVAFDAYAHKISIGAPLRTELAELSAKVPEFWLKALSNCGQTSVLIDAVDREALTFLKDVKVVYGEKDVRDFDVVFTFSAKNPFFTNTTLTKSYTVTPPSPPLPSAHDLDAPLYTKATKIEWTSKEHNLELKAPRVKIEELEEFDDFGGSIGSFFCFFGEEGRDEMNLGEMLLEWYSHAVEYAAGLSVAIGEEDEDDYDSEDEEDEEDPKEIDLESEEERPKKKSKKA